MKMTMTLQEALILREGALSHAETLLASAMEVTAPHIRYHLSVLALEEVGKAELQPLKAATALLPDDDKTVRDREEDHRQKLAWAFFTARGQGGLPTEKDIRDAKKMADRVHDRRVTGLYYDPSGKASAIGEEESREMLRLAEARLRMAQSLEAEEAPEADKAALTWLLQSLQDDRFRKFASGAARQLESGIDQAEAARRIKFAWEEYGAANRALMHQELQRDPAASPHSRKWLVEVRFESMHQFIDERVLAATPLTQAGVTLLPDKKDRRALLARFELPSFVPVDELWSTGHYVSRLFLLALNVGTMQPYWWRMSRQKTKYYEKLRDQTADADLELDRNEADAVDWGRKDTLSEVGLAQVMVCYGFLLRRFLPPRDPYPLHTYELGVAGWALHDVNCYLTPSAFAYFLQCYGEWGALFGQRPAERASYLLEEFFSQLSGELTDLGAFLALVRRAENTREVPAKVGAKYVSYLKLACDALLLKAATERFQSDTAALR